MKDLAQEILVAILVFFGINEKQAKKLEGKSKDAFDLLCKVFLTNPNIEPATQAENAETTSKHTTTAHNSDSTKYFEIRDKRIPEVPLRLQPVESKDSILTYAVVMDSEKISDLRKIKKFAEIYMAKTLKSKKTFASLVSTLTCRQANEDIINNTRQKENNKRKDRTTNETLAAPFISLPEEIWQTIRTTMIVKSEELCEVIDELRASAN